MLPDSRTTSPGRTCSGPRCRPAGIDADASRRDVQAVGGALADHLRVAGDQADAGSRGCLGHVGGDLAKLGDREAFLDHERRRQPHRLGTGDSEVVDRAVHGEMADRSAGKSPRLHDERVGGECQPLAGRQRQGCRVGKGRVLAAGECLDEHGVDQRRRRLAAGTVRERDHVVGQARPSSPECLDPVEDGCFSISHCRHRRPRLVFMLCVSAYRACTARHSAKPSAACVSWMR